MADEQNKSQSIAFLFFTALLVPPGVAGALKASYVTRHPLASVGIGLVWLVLVAVGSIVSGLFEKWREDIINRLSDLLLRKDARLERRYLNRVRDELRWAEGGGVSSGTSRRQGETPRLALDMVFVDSGLSSGTAGPGEGLLPHIADEDGGDSNSLIGLVNREDNPPSILVVKGVPGSGKTTLLRHAALHACDRDWFRWRRRGADRRIPILLYLREHGDDIAANPSRSLIDLLTGPRFQISGGPQLDWFRKKFEQGECLVLLDGLDEVAREDDRRVIAGWARQQCDVHGKNRFVLSSRPSGYQAGSIPGAEVVSVQGFDHGQIETYIGRWYREVEKNAGWAARERAASAAHREEVAEQKSRDLWRQLEAADDLMSLAANPLLLTLIATVHRGGETLPRRRTDIYMEICEAVLWRRAQAKGVPSKLEGRQKQAILAGLAYEMMRRLRTELPKSDVTGVIADALKSMTTDPGLTAETFLAEASVDGLLIMPTADSYAFTHKTFQEYLAAAHIKDNGLDVLPGEVGNSWWEETIVFHASIADAGPVVRACLDKNTFGTLQLALRCGEAPYQLSTETRERLETFRPAIETNLLQEKTSGELRSLARLLLARFLGQSSSADSNGAPRLVLVPAGIYRVFLADKKPVPDAPAIEEQEPDAAVVGIRACDAMAFVAWINEASTGSPAYRLVGSDVLDGLSAWPTLPGGFPARVWTQSASEDPTVIDLWCSPSDAISTDERQTQVALMLPSDQDIFKMLQLVLVLHRIRVFLDSVPARSVRSSPLARVIRAFLDSVPIRSVRRSPLAVAVACFLPRNTRVLALDVALARLDVALIRGFDYDSIRERTLVSDLGYFIDRFFVLDYDDLARVPDIVPDISGGQASDPVGLLRERDFDFTDIDRWGRRHMGTALSRAISGFPNNFLTPDFPVDEFVSVFREAVGVSADWPLPRMDELPETLDKAARALREALGSPRPDQEVPGDWARGVAERLTENAEPVLSRRERVTPWQAISIRVAALCLAGEADALERKDIGDQFRDIAAGITWLEGRQSGEIPATEVIMLAAQ